MNKVKPTTYSSASSNKPNVQSRISNSSLTQNSPVAPKSIDRLSKPTGSNYANNNVIDMSQKGYTGNTNSGRPGSANSQKGGKPSNPTANYGASYTTAVAQQQKRSTTPTQNRNGTTGSPGPNLVPGPLPMSRVVQSPYSAMIRLASPTSKQATSPQPPYQASQQPQKAAATVSPTLQSQQQPQKQIQSNADATPLGQRTPAPVSTTASNSSIKSNSSNRTKTNTASNPQQNKAPAQNNNAGSKPQEVKPGVTINASVTPKPSAKTFPTPISHTRYSSNISRSMVSLERSRNFRAFIEKAMNDHKIFNCCGVYPAVRNALKKRGWVEKPGPLAYSRSANTTLLQARGIEDESDVAWMTRVLKDYPPDFIWVIRRDNIDWKNLTKDQMINRFPKAWFTTKVGLAACLQHMHWFSEAGVADTFFPRCYRLCLEEERQAFQDDYRLTACMSYLRYFVDTFEAKGHTALADVHSKITPLSVDFASRQLGNYIRMRRHEDIDWLLPPNFMTQHWDAFIHQYYAVVHERKRLRFDSAEAVHVKYETAKKTLQKVGQYWPQIQLDGVNNFKHFKIRINAVCNI